MMMNEDKGCRRFKFPGRLFFFKSVPEKVRFGQLISSLLVSFGFLLCTLTFHFMDVLCLKRNKSVFDVKVLKLATFRYASDGRILLQTVQFFQISRSHQPPICSVSSRLLALPAYSRDWDAYEHDHESLTVYNQNQVATKHPQ